MARKTGRAALVISADEHTHLERLRDSRKALAARPCAAFARSVYGRTQANQHIAPVAPLFSAIFRDTGATCG